VIDLHLFRRAAAAHLGQMLTPEVAAQIEMACRIVRAPVDLEALGSETHGDYVLRAERMADILDELHPLHVAHWQETEKHRHGLPLEPDYDYMLGRERDGTMVQFTLRRGGVLVGNLRMYLGLSRHSGTRFAQEDTFYVMPEHRKGLLAIRFWQFMERAVRALGAVEIRTDSKLINRVNRLNEYLGYTPVATKFVKVFQE
jgi:hypothetical protein